MTGTMRDLLQRQGLKVGFYLGEFATSGIGDILRPTGVDFVFVDMEHSGFTYETVKATVRHLHAAGIASLVRPPSKDYHDISRALDVGAQALIPPMMSAPEAERVAKFMKYPPAGGRGVALGIAHDDYQPGDPAQTLAAANEKTAFVALIETVAGLADVEKIAAMPGVDALFIGHFDLTCSMGINAQFDHPDFHAAVARIAKAAKDNNKPVGRMAMTPEDCAGLYEQGFELVTYSGDVWLFQSSLAEGIRKLRALTNQ